MGVVLGTWETIKKYLIRKEDTGQPLGALSFVRKESMG
jgi:hypothetical protein